MHKVQSTPLVGLPQQKGWSQVLTKNDPQVVYVVAIQGVNASNVGRDVIDTLSQAQLDTPVDFHTVVTQVLGEVRHKDCQLQLAAGYFTDDKSFFLAVNGSVLLKRAIKVAELVVSSGEVKLIQGRRQPDDVVVLLTDQARSFNEEIIQKFSQGYDVDTVITSMVPRLHGQADSSLSAIAFISAAPELASVAAEPAPEAKITLEELVATPDEPETDALSLSELTSPTPVVSPSFDSTPVTPTPSLLRPLESSGQLAPAVPVTTRLKTASLGLFSRLQHFKQPSFLSGGVARYNPFSRDVYVDRDSRRKAVRWLLPVVIGLVVVGLGIMIYRSRIQQQVQALDETIAPFKASIAEARQQVDQNPLQARERVATAITQMEAARTTFAGQSYALKKLETELSAAQQVYQEISGKEELNELPTFYDLRYAQTEFVTSTAVGKAKRGLFVDAEKGRVISLNLENQQFQLFEPGAQPRIQDVSLYDDRIWMLGGGLRSVSVVGTASATVVKEEGESNRAGQFIELYNRYIYIFNPEKRNIYRYAPTADGYTDPIGWLTSSQGLDFAQVTSLSIDGDIWLGTKTGEIKKFTTGRPAEFTLKGMTEPFDSSIIVYTSEELQNLYVLEPNKQRVVILSKTGEFLREVRSVSLASATGLIADEQLQRIFPVSGSIIFQIPL
ncbi:MAG TPA: hypothetical protein VD999_02670 [Vitreimonas sp.]|nr:hypothetical protein [Vitreimonas sp.]